MKRYAKIVNEETGLAEVGLGTNEAFYAGLGMKKQEVEASWNGAWYRKGRAPAKPPEAQESGEEKVRRLEEQTGLTRAVRELALAENSGVSEYVKEKARELEALARFLRAGENAAQEGKPGESSVLTAEPEEEKSLGEGENV